MASHPSQQPAQPHAYDPPTSTLRAKDLVGVVDNMLIPIEQHQNDLMSMLHRHAGFTPSLLGWLRWGNIIEYEPLAYASPCVDFLAICDCVIPYANAWAMIAHRRGWHRVNQKMFVAFDRHGNPDPNVTLDHAVIEEVVGAWTVDDSIQVPRHAYRDAVALLWTYLRTDRRPWETWQLKWGDIDWNEAAETFATPLDLITPLEAWHDIYEQLVGYQPRPDDAVFIPTDGTATRRSMNLKTGTKMPALSPMRQHDFLAIFSQRKLDGYARLQVVEETATEGERGEDTCDFSEDDYGCEPDADEPF